MTERTNGSVMTEDLMSDKPNQGLRLTINQEQVLNKTIFIVDHKIRHGCCNVMVSCDWSLFYETTTEKSWWIMDNIYFQIHEATCTRVYTCADKGCCIFQCTGMTHLPLICCVLLKFILLNLRSDWCQWTQECPLRVSFLNTWEKTVFYFYSTN